MFRSTISWADGSLESWVSVIRKRLSETDGPTYAAFFQGPDEILIGELDLKGKPTRFKKCRSQRKWSTYNELIATGTFNRPLAGYGIKPRVGNLQTPRISSVHKSRVESWTGSSPYLQLHRLWHKPRIHCQYYECCTRLGRVAHSTKRDELYLKGRK